MEYRWCCCCCRQRVLALFLFLLHFALFASLLLPVNLPPSCQRESDNFGEKKIQLGNVFFLFFFLSHHHLESKLPNSLVMTSTSKDKTWPTSHFFEKFDAVGGGGGGAGAARLRDSILASHVAVQGSILCVSKNLFWCCWDLSQVLVRRLDNVDRTHLALASGKLFLRCTLRKKKWCRLENFSPNNEKKP